MDLLVLPVVAVSGIVLCAGCLVIWSLRRRRTPWFDPQNPAGYAWSCPGPSMDTAWKVGGTNAVTDGERTLVMVEK
jgi:hypothetical protein